MTEPNQQDGFGVFDYVSVRISDSIRLRNIVKNMVKLGTFDDVVKALEVKDAVLSVCGISVNVAQRSEIFFSFFLFTNFAAPPQGRRGTHHTNNFTPFISLPGVNSQTLKHTKRMWMLYYVTRKVQLMTTAQTLL